MNATVLCAAMECQRCSIVKRDRYIFTLSTCCGGWLCNECSKITKKLCPKCCVAGVLAKEDTVLLRAYNLLLDMLVDMGGVVQEVPISPENTEQLISSPIQTDVSLTPSPVQSVGNGDHHLVDSKSDKILQKSVEGDELHEKNSKNIQDADVSSRGRQRLRSSRVLNNENINRNNNDVAFTTSTLLNLKMEEPCTGAPKREPTPKRKREIISNAESPCKKTCRGTSSRIGGHGNHSALESAIQHANEESEIIEYVYIRKSERIKSILIRNNAKEESVQKCNSKRGKSTTESPKFIQVNVKEESARKRNSKRSKSTSESPKLIRVNAKGESALHQAVHRNSISEIRRLLAEGSNPNCKDHAGWTPLHDAIAKRGDVTVVAYLLKNGAVVNVHGFQAKTPLHIAVEENREDCVTELVNNGADPDARDIFGNTPRGLAAKSPRLLALIPRKVTSAPSIVTTQPLLAIVSHKLSKEDNAIVDQFIQTFDVKEEKIKNLVNASHFIIKSSEVANNFDLNLVRVLVNGASIVTISWVEACLKEGKVLDSSLYEYVPPWMPGWSEARLNALNYRPGLFSGCHIMIKGDGRYRSKFGPIDLRDLRVFIKEAGGTVMTRMPDPESPHRPDTLPFHATGNMIKCSQIVVYIPNKTDRSIKYNMAHLKCLPIEWLLQCIFEFKILPYDVQLETEHQFRKDFS